MVKNDGRGVTYTLLIGLTGLAMAMVETGPLLACKRVTSQSALETLRRCPDSLSERRHKRFMDGLSQLTSEHLNGLLQVAGGTGPLSCRGLAIVEAGYIAADDPRIEMKVLHALTPYLSDPDLWQAAVQAIIPIGPSVNDDLHSQLDTQDEFTWQRIIVILQNINHAGLAEGSELRSYEFPDTVEGRARISALWRTWWQNARK